MTLVQWIIVISLAVAAVGASVQGIRHRRRNRLIPLPPEAGPYKFYSLSEPAPAPEVDNYFKDIRDAIRKDHGQMEGQLPLWETGEMPVVALESPVANAETVPQLEQGDQGTPAAEAASVAPEPSYEDLQAVAGMGLLMAASDAGIRAVVGDPDADSSFMREWKENLDAWVVEQAEARLQWRKDCGVDCE